MDDMIGLIVVLIIISGLAYALIKQMEYSKVSENMVGSPLIRKQLKRKNKVMTVALFGVLVFFTLNIVSGLNIAISNNFTALGTLVSFFIYFYAKFAMPPKQVDQPGSFYN